MTRKASTPKTIAPYAMRTTRPAPRLRLSIGSGRFGSRRLAVPGGRVLPLEALRGAAGELGLGDVQVQGIARLGSNVNDGSTALLRFQIPEGRDQTQVVQQVETAIHHAHAVPQARPNAGREPAAKQMRIPISRSGRDRDDRTQLTVNQVKAVVE